MQKSLSVTTIAVALNISLKYWVLFLNYSLPLPNVYFHQFFLHFLCILTCICCHLFVLNNRMKRQMVGLQYKLGKAFVIKIKQTVFGGGGWNIEDCSCTQNEEGKKKHCFSLLEATVICWFSILATWQLCNVTDWPRGRWGGGALKRCGAGYLCDLHHENIDVTLFFAKYSTDNFLVYFHNSWGD